GASDAPPRDLVGLEPVDADAVEENGAAVGPEELRDEVEDRALARSVGADEADDARRRDLERAPADRAETPEGLREPRHREPGRSRRRSWTHRSEPRVPSSPTRTGERPRTSRPPWRRPPRDRSEPSCRPGPGSPRSGWACGAPRRAA